MRLVRHGEVAAEHRGTFYGGAEVPLSPAGLAESRELAARLAADPPDQVWSSPLSRALAVAEPLAAAVGRSLHIEEGFRELDRGQWTHVARDEIERRWPGAIAAYLADPEGAAAPGGETESVFAGRVWSALDRVVAGAAGGRLVIVSHGHVIRVIMKRLAGWDGPTSLHHFVPCHAVVELSLGADGAGEILAAPDPVLPEALRTP